MIGSALVICHDECELHTLQARYDLQGIRLCFSRERQVASRIDLALRYRSG
jgi:hypothetical protein